MLNKEYKTSNFRFVFTKYEKIFVTLDYSFSLIFLYWYKDVIASSVFVRISFVYKHY